jgi:hypothetical protein
MTARQSEKPTTARLIGGRTFSYDEALESFPMVRDLTLLAQHRISTLLEQVGGPEDLEERRESLEAEVQEIVSDWATEVSSLGCQVKGLWLVDWDSGDGYYCWKHPEETVAHFHGYDEGFEGRVPIN